MVLLLLTFCLLLLPLSESVIVLCLVVCYFMSILVLKSSWWERESWLLCLICLSGVSRWLSGSSSRFHGVVCGLWLWYFLIILTYYFTVIFLYICEKVSYDNNLGKVCWGMFVLTVQQVWNPKNKLNCPSTRESLSSGLQLIKTQTKLLIYRNYLECWNF